MNKSFFISLSFAFHQILLLGWRNTIDILKIYILAIKESTPMEIDESRGERFEQSFLLRKSSKIAPGQVGN